MVWKGLWEVGVNPGTATITLVCLEQVTNPLRVWVFLSVKQGGQL